MQRTHYAKKKVIMNGARLRVGIAVSEFNNDITDRMLAGALEALDASAVKKNNIQVIRVPGSFELPFACLTFLKKKKYDAVIALGCIIKGETTHDIYIASAVSKGIMDLSLQYGVPVIFGVLTTNNLAQAKARSTGKANKGIEAALTAVSMALCQS
jgi:6,7-dimethyl-8-ribityllumazine synthase